MKVGLSVKTFVDFDSPNAGSLPYVASCYTVQEMGYNKSLVLLSKTNFNSNLKFGCRSSDETVIASNCLKLVVTARIEWQLGSVLFSLFKASIWTSKHHS